MVGEEPALRCITRRVKRCGKGAVQVTVAEQQRILSIHDRREQRALQVTGGSVRRRGL